MSSQNWKKYAVEFISIFIAVISAFALNNWNENRRDARAETKILIEIRNGLEKDINDVKENMTGHEQGVNACTYFRRVLREEETNVDTVRNYYYLLTRDFISIQNTSGYETLKSKGLELVQDDSLRTSIISLYEYDYNTLKKLEEEYHELQFQANYFQDINQFVAPHLEFDALGDITNLNLPLKLSQEEKQIFLSYLSKIEFNRRWILVYYEELKQKITQLRQEIEAELAQR